MNVWRLQTKTDNQTNYKISDYCIKNKILALGWSLNEKHLEKKVEERNFINDIIKERNLIGKGNEEENFKNYKNFVNKYQIYKDINNIIRLKEKIKPFDLIWMRSEGIYWLGLVGENSRYLFNSIEEALKMDASNQRTDIEWFEIGGESHIAGVIATSFIQGHALQRINQQGVQEFSQNLINQNLIKLGLKPIYNIKKMENNPETLFNLISPNDCEDAVCMWLFYKRGYITIPSTCKKSTELYECVLINPDRTEDKEVYIQVKKGAINLNCSDYKHLQGEVWLFSTGGEVIGEESSNIKIIDKCKIYDFIMNDKNDNLLPNKIIKWRNLLKNS